MVARQADKKSKQKKQAVASKEQTPPANKQAPKAKARRYRRQEDNLEHHIYRLLKQIHPGTGIGRDAMNCINNMLLDCYVRLARASSEVCNHSKN